MASFNVSTNWGKWLALRGFRVEPNKAYVPPEFPITRLTGNSGKQRPMRVFAPEGMGGKRALAWFKEQFRRDHKAVRSDCGCCPPHIVPTFPFQDSIKRTFQGIDIA